MGLFEFDIFTLRVAIALVLAFAAPLFGVAALVYPDEKALRTWAVSNSLTAVAALALLLSNVQASLPLLVPLGALFSVGMALGWVGLRQLCDAPLPRRGLTALAAAGFTFLVLLPAAGILPIINGIRYLIWGAPSLAIIAYSIDLLRLRGPLQREYAWFLALFSLLGAVALIGSGIFGIVADVKGHWQGLKPVVLEIALALMVPGTLATNWSAMMMFTAKLRDQLKRLAETDGLTGLTNRSAFKAAATRVLRRSAVRGNDCALLVVDLDHFKSINDTHGHDGGDEALRRFSALLQRRTRSDDLIGRVGGEEFCVLLPGCQAQAALQMAERLRSEAEAEPVPFNGTAIAVTTSIGLAMLRPEDTLDTLFVRADRALYAAKTGGRNRVVIADGDLIS